MLKNKKLSLTLLATAAMLVFSALFIVHVKKQGTQSNRPISQASHTQPQNSPDTQTALETTAAGIQKVDELQTIQSQPAPTGWKKFENSAYKIDFAYPASLKATTVELPTASEGGQGGEHSVIFSDSSGMQVQYCVLNILDKSFSSWITEYEQTDTGDDGKVVDQPRRIWSDIKEKDTFTINTHLGVRYLETIRSSTRANFKTVVSYVIDFNHKTYVFSTDSTSTDDSNTAYRMLQSFHFSQ